MLYVILIFCGLLVGFLSSFFGVGGGILIVPTLYALFPGISPVIVISCSLSIILTNGIINLINFKRSGKPLPFKVFYLVFPGILIGVYMGSLALALVSSQAVKILFALVLVIVCLKTLLTKKPQIDEGDFNLSKRPKSFYMKIFFICLVGGLTQSLTGLGGGLVFIPLFISLLAMPLNWVPVYSNACMIVGSINALVINSFSIDSTSFNFPTLLEQFQIQHINFLVVLLFVAGSLFTSPLGIIWGNKISAHKKKICFVCLLSLAAARIFYQTLFS